MTDKPLFIYGTLRHAPLYAAVAGEALAGTEALLSDHVVAEAMGQGGRHLGFPLFTPRPATSQVCAPSTSSQTRTQRVHKMQRLGSNTKRSWLASTFKSGCR